MTACRMNSVFFCNINQDSVQHKKNAAINTKTCQSAQSRFKFFFVLLFNPSYSFVEYLFFKYNMCSSDFYVRQFNLSQLCLQFCSSIRRYGFLSVIQYSCQSLQHCKTDCKCCYSVLSYFLSEKLFRLLYKPACTLCVEAALSITLTQILGYPLCQLCQQFCFLSGSQFQTSPLCFYHIGFLFEFKIWVLQFANLQQQSSSLIGIRKSLCQQTVVRL